MIRFFPSNKTSGAFRKKAGLALDMPRFPVQQPAAGNVPSRGRLRRFPFLIQLGLLIAAAGEGGIQEIFPAWKANAPKKKNPAQRAG